MLNDEILEERLHEDLDRFHPGFAPVDALITHGRAIKARRRAGFAAGLAAVAALAVSVPTVLGGGGSSTTSAAGHRTVLASGTIDGKEWSFVTGEPGDAGYDGCLGYVAGHWGMTSSGTCLGALPAATDPVFLTSSGGEGDVRMFIAQLRPDVERVTVTETGAAGTVLTPAIAQVSGRRYAFFALPPHYGIAYLGAVGFDGQTIAYTEPYNGLDNTAPSLITTWYPAGTRPTQEDIRAALFPDKPSSSAPVTVTVDMGAFGVCYLLSAPLNMPGGNSYGPDCHSVTPPAATELSLRRYPIGDRDLVLAEVNNAVDHVDATLSDGTTARLTPTRVGGHSFVVRFLGVGVKISEARAYDASGAQLAKTP